MKYIRILTIYRVLLGGGITFSVFLIINDILLPGYCPKLWIIPACYPVLLYFLFPFLLSFVEISLEKTISYLCFGTGIVTAINFSARKIFSFGHCPEILSIPLCFAAFVTFSLLMILRIKLKKIVIKM